MSKYKCIFCQSAEKLTREHIWADWLRAYLPRSRPRTTHHISGTPTKNKIVPGKLARPGDPHAQRLQVVCKRCNETWMGRMQETAKPYIVPLLDHWMPLDRAGQAALANWATMFTMVYEFADPKTAVVPQKHRSYFMKNLAPPPLWMIWIGRVDLKNAHPANANHHGAKIIFDPNGLPRKYDFQSTGFTVGNIFFQTLMFEPPYRTVDAVAVAKYFDLRVIQPFQGLIASDPAPTILDNMGFYAVSNGFAEALGMPTFYLPSEGLL